MVDIAVLGQGDLATHIAKKVYEDDDANLVEIITKTDAELNIDPDRSVNMLKVESVNKDIHKDRIKKYDLDVMFCVGWYEIIDEDMFNIPKHGMIGIHASPLPKGRGGAPVNWQIIYGMTNVTISMFKFTEKVDDGPLLSQKSVPIETRDDIQSVYNKVIIESGEMVRNNILNIKNDKINYRQQSHENATYWPQRKPQDGIINWNLPASSLSDFILAQTNPYPCAYSFFEGKKMRIVDIKRENVEKTPNSRFDPGQIVNIVPGEGVKIMTKDRPLTITKLSYNHEPSQWADRWAKKQGVSIGQEIGTTESFPEDFLYTGLRGAAGRSDYQLTTNAKVGEQVRNTAIIYSPSRHSEMTIDIKKDGEKITSNTHRTKGWTEYPFTLTPSMGENHVSVIFLHNESQIDKRQFYIYSKK